MLFLQFLHLRLQGAHLRHRAVSAQLQREQDGLDDQRQDDNRCAEGVGAQRRLELVRGPGQRDVERLGQRVDEPEVHTAVELGNREVFGVAVEQINFLGTGEQQGRNFNRLTGLHRNAALVDILRGHRLPLAQASLLQTVARADFVALARDQRHHPVFVGKADPAAGADDPAGLAGGRVQPLFGVGRRLGDLAVLVFAQFALEHRDIAGGGVAVVDHLVVAVDGADRRKGHALRAIVIKPVGEPEQVVVDHLDPPLDTNAGGRGGFEGQRRVGRQFVARDHGPLRLGVNQRATDRRHPVVGDVVATPAVLRVQQVDEGRGRVHGLAVAGQGQVIENRAGQVQRSGQHAGVDGNALVTVQRRAARDDGRNRLPVCSGDGQPARATFAALIARLRRVHLWLRLRSQRRKDLRQEGLHRKDQQQRNADGQEHIAHVFIHNRCPVTRGLSGWGRGVGRVLGRVVSSHGAAAIGRTAILCAAALSHHRRTSALPCIWDRVIAVTTPGVTTADPPYGQPAPTQGTVPLQGFERVDAARGLIAAGWRQPGRYQQTVANDRNGDEAAAPAHGSPRGQPAGAWLGVRCAHGFCAPAVASASLVPVRARRARSPSRRSLPNGAITAPRLAIQT